MEVRQARFDELPVRTLYEILHLRAVVFVVEQRCVYLDPDGRDREPATRHWWIDDRGVVASTLRVLREPNATTRIGRVATRQSHRRAGLAERLVRAAMAECDGIVDIDAQVQLENWYGRLGFRRIGPPFPEDGIWHVPMRATAVRP